MYLQMSVRSTSKLTLHTFKHSPNAATANTVELRKKSKSERGVFDMPL